jgi:hypothetical protein
VGDDVVVDVGRPEYKIVVGVSDEDVVLQCSERLSHY